MLCWLKKFATKQTLNNMTTRVQCDVDIDFLDREEILSLIPHIDASRYNKGDLKKHNTGVYFQDVPMNPLTGAATIDYEEAEARGYFKIDFLNVSAYQGVKGEDHIKDLLLMEPIGELLWEKEICDQLAHINGYHVLVGLLKPKSINELAMVLALIRPAKKHLIDRCVEQGFKSIEGEIWTKPIDGSYAFKKSHAISYAHLIVMQLNLICQQAMQ